MCPIESSLNVQSPVSLVDALLALTYYPEPIRWHQVAELLHHFQPQLPKELQPSAKTLIPRILPPEFILPPLPMTSAKEKSKKSKPIDPQSIAAVLSDRVLSEQHAYFQPLTWLINNLKNFKQEMQPFANLLMTVAPTLLEAVDGLITEYQDFRKRFAKGSVKLRQQLLHNKPLLQGHYGTYYLQEGVAEHIFPVTEEGAVQRRNTVGSHCVSAYRGMHFKVNPDAPGIEYSVHALATVLGAVTSTPSILLRLWQYQWKYPVLVTQSVPGERFDNVLTNQPQQLQQLDPLQFGEALCVSWLVRPQDGKAQNYIFKTHEVSAHHLALNEDNNNAAAIKYHLVNIDQDMSFAEPIALQKRGNAKGKHSVEVRDILYLLPNMNEQVPAAFYQRFANQSALELVSVWLNQLRQQNERYTQWREHQLFSEVDYAQLGLPIMLRSGTVAGIYQRLSRLIAACQQADTTKTWWDLFAAIDPFVCKVYQRLLSKNFLPKDPLKAYEYLQQSYLEDWLETGLTEDQSLLSELASHTADAQDFIHERTQTLTEALVELMEVADFQSLEPTQQTTIFQLWSQWSNLPLLKIHQAAGLTNEWLHQLTQHSVHTLKNVSLLNCANLTPHAYYTLVEQRPGLNLAISQTIKASFQEWPRWAKQCSTLTLVLKEGTRLTVLGHEDITRLPSLWLELAKQGALSGLKYLLQQNTPLDSHIAGETALHVAAKAGHLAVARWLISEGAKLDSLNQAGHTPLYKAIVAGQWAMVDELVQQGASWDLPKSTAPTDPLKGCDTPAHALFQYADFPTVQRFTANWRQSEWDCRLVAYDQKGQQLLHRAIINPKGVPSAVVIDDKNNNNSHAPSILSLCLAKGADPCAQIPLLEATPLHLAARLGYLGAIQVLRQVLQTDDLEVRTRGGVTALKMAEDNNHTTVVQYLNSQRDATNKDKPVLPQGNTPLHDAALNGRLDDVQSALRQQPVIVNKHNTLGRTALHLACEGGARTVKNYALETTGLLKRVKRIFSSAQTPAELIEAEFLEILDSLQKAGANVNAIDNYGDTPLLIAIEVSRSVKIIDWLLRHNANILAKDQNDNNIFHKIFAVKRNRFAITQYLLEQAPEVLTDRDLQQRGKVDNAERQRMVKDWQKQLYTLAVEPDNSGQAPIHLLAGKESEVDEPEDQEKTLQLYFKHKLPASYVNDADESPLHFATGRCIRPQVSVLKLITPHILKVNKPDVNGRTALHWLVMKASAENNWLLPEIEVLLAAKADPDIADYDSNTPRSLAASFPKVLALINRFVPEERISQPEVLGSAELTNRVKKYMGWDLLLYTLYQYLIFSSSEETERLQYQTLFERYQDVYTPIYGARLTDLIQHVLTDDNNDSAANRFLAYEGNTGKTALPNWVRLAEDLLLKDRKTLFEKRKLSSEEASKLLRELQQAAANYNEHPNPSDALRQAWIEAFDRYQQAEIKREFYDQLYGRASDIGRLIQQGEHYQTHYQQVIRPKLAAILSELSKESNRYQKLYYRLLLRQLNVFVTQASWQAIWDPATRDRVAQIEEVTRIELQTWEISKDVKLTQLAEPELIKLFRYANELRELQAKTQSLQRLPKRTLEQLHESAVAEETTTNAYQTSIVEYHQLLERLMTWIHDQDFYAYCDTCHPGYLASLVQPIENQLVQLNAKCDNQLTLEELSYFQEYQSIADFLQAVADTQKLGLPVNGLTTRWDEPLIEENISNDNAIKQDVDTTLPPPVYATSAEAIATSVEAIQTPVDCEQINKRLTLGLELNTELTRIRSYRQSQFFAPATTTANDTGLPPPPPPIEGIDEAPNLSPIDIKATHTALGLNTQISGFNKSALKSVQPNAKLVTANPFMGAIMDKMKKIREAVEGQDEEKPEADEFTSPSLDQF